MNEIHNTDHQQAKRESPNQTQPRTKKVLTDKEVTKITKENERSGIYNPVQLCKHYEKPKIENAWDEHISIPQWKGIGPFKTQHVAHLKEKVQHTYKNMQGGEPPKQIQAHPGSTAKFWEFGWR